MPILSGVEPKYVEDNNLIFPKHRPRFGSKQIRTPKALVVGKEIAKVNNETGIRKRIVITRSPYQEDHHWWIDYEIKGTGIPKRISLSDFSVLPNGQVWNDCFWLERV